MDARRFGAELKRMRKARGLTQEALMDKLRALGYPGFDPQIISRIECGRRAPTQEQLWFLLQYFVREGEVRNPQQAQGWVKLLGRNLSDSELEELFGEQAKEAYSLAQPEWSVPCEPAYYVVPRRAMAALEALVESDEWNGEWPILITGMAGVGKTTLLKAFARRPERRAQFQYALWADLATRDALHWQGRWAEILGLDLGGIADADRRRGMLAVRLEHESALLLINDVWEASEATPLLVGGPACRTVISTREELPVGAELRVGGQARICVEPFGADADGVTLLRKYLGELSESEEQFAAEIVRLVEGLPLALEILAALLLYSGQWSEVLDDLREPAYLPELPSGLERHRSVWSALTIGYNRVDKVQQRRFRVLGGLAERATFGWETASALWSLDGRAVRQTLLALQGRHLVRREGERYRLHRLVHRFARSLMTDEEAETSYRVLVTHFAQRFSTQSNRFMFGGRQHIGPGLAVAESEWPQVRALAQQTTARGDWDSGYRLMMAVANYLAASERWTPLVEWCESLAAIAPRWKEPEWADVMRNWGLALLADRRVEEAILRFKDALSYTDNEGDRFGIFTLLAGAYLELQDRERSWRYLQRAEQLAEQHAVFSPGYLKAKAKWEATWGHRALALQCLAQAEQGFRSLGADMDATTITEERAGLCKEMGDLSRAEGLYRRAAAERKGYGQVHSQLRCLIEVGKVLWQSGRDEELWALYDNELSSLWQELPDGQKEPDWWLWMGFFAARLEEIESCRRYWAKAVEIPGLSEQQKVEIRLEWAGVEVDIGDRQRALELLAEAEPHFRQVNDTEALADLDRLRHRAELP